MGSGFGFGFGFGLWFRFTVKVTVMVTVTVTVTKTAMVAFTVTMTVRKIGMPSGSRPPRSAVCSDEPCRPSAPCRVRIRVRELLSELVEFKFINYCVSPAINIKFNKQLQMTLINDKLGLGLGLGLG